MKGEKEQARRRSPEMEEERMERTMHLGHGILHIYTLVEWQWT